MRNNNAASENCHDKKDKEEVHPWRLCPAGEHWVCTHQMHVPPSKSFPEGHETIRHGHCARNPSGKDALYPDEIKEIDEQHFANVEPKPCPLELKFGKRGSQYDDLIAGWTKYWNDIFSPCESLDPNLVKALIASESHFDPNILANKKNPKSGRGLMQVLDSTRMILNNENGELKNHFVHVTRADLNNPSINICAGIRWLFQKQKLASSKLGHEANWEETIYEFKGLSTVPKERAEKLLKKFKDLHELYKKCGKK